MEILRASRWRDRPALVLAALFGAAVVGCTLVDSAFEGGEAPFAFDHKVHVTDQGLDCGDCHRRWESAEDPGMPSAAQCALCHKDLDAAKPPERQVAKLFADGKYLRAPRAVLADEILFSHVQHATREEECAACHTQLDARDAETPPLTHTMDGCMSCHTERKTSNDCAVCHSVVRADVAPADHAQDWKRAHGPKVRACRGMTAARCDLCHKESDCQTCHMSELPQSHNAHFRRRGHGLIASMDRQSCATCHTPDSCDRCHAETRPLDHTGMWGAPLDRHCLACHEPLRSQSCFTCHKETPSHAQATPMPPDHLPGMNCRMCHGNGQPLPHVDNGDACTTCHM